MPIWVYIYCFIIVLCSAYNIFRHDNFRYYQTAGEVLDFLSAFIMIFIAYKFLVFEHSNLIATACLIYTFWWSYHAHKHHLEFEKFKQEVIQDLDEDDIGHADKIAKQFYIVTWILMLIMILPLLYFYLKAIGVFQ